MTAWLKHQFRKVQRWPRWLFWPLVWLLKAYLRLMRVEIRDPQRMLYPDKFPLVAIMWHNRLFFYPLLLRPGTRVCVANVVSASRDGQYLADVMALLGFRLIRGSTRKKAAIALRGALAELRRGYTVGLSPDGPRGPRYHLSQGPVVLASRTGAPILPLAVNCSSHWTLKSWDRYQIPKPFARVVLEVGDTITVPPRLDEAGLAHWRRLVEERLNDLSLVPAAERGAPDQPEAPDEADGPDQGNGGGG